ncbi:MAG: hypothetical protein JO363_05465, partial [Solirubrobacterales bacterium]|nr:hypothetical protein [Solirubrobacterales bacterium]
MSALATPAEGVQLPPAVVKSRREALRRIPTKAKVGAALLGMFVLVAIIGPSIAP